MTKSENLQFHTEKRKVKDLVPFEYNPRKISEQQQEELKKSLEKYGLAEIPVIDTNNKICAGHQRVATLLLMGKGEHEIDVRVPNREMTEEEFKEYNIRSNKNTGDWDWDILGEKFDMVDLLDWGFSENEIDLIFNDDFRGDLGEAPISESQQNTKSIPQLVFGKYKIPMTDEEVRKLTSSLDGYLEENGVFNGYVLNILSS